MYISVPPFQEIDGWMKYSDDEKMRAVLEYTNLLADVQSKSDSFAALYRQMRSACKANPRNDKEAIRLYCERVRNSLSSKNPIYSNAYMDVLIVSVLINEWRMSV